MGIVTYDPKLVSFSIGENTIVGYAPGTFIEFEANEDEWTTVVGADGKTCRVKSNNLTAQFRVTLMQTSPSNDILSALRNADRISNSGSKPAFLKDGGGRTVISAQNCWVKKLAPTAYATDHSTREWVLETDEYAPPNIGGN